MSSSTVAEEHLATLGRLGDVFAHHTFEFDGETDADGSGLLEGPPSAVQPLHHTNNTLKFLLTCCKAMVEASLSSSAAASSSPLPLASGNSAADGVESMRKEFEGRLRRVEEEAHRRHNEAAAAVQRLAADVDRRLGAVEASVAAAASAVSRVSSTTGSAHSPSAPAGSGGPNADRLTALEKSVARQFKLVEREVTSVRSAVDDAAAAHSAALSELDALHRERLNAALTSTYSQMDSALEDFATVEALEALAESTQRDISSSVAAATAAASAKARASEDERESEKDRRSALEERVAAAEAAIAVIRSAAEADLRERAEEGAAGRARSAQRQQEAKAAAEEALERRVEEALDRFREAHVAPLAATAEAAAARAEMHVSDMRADLADCSAQAATWNGIIAGNESLKARVAVLEATARLGAGLGQKSAVSHFHAADAQPLSASQLQQVRSAVAEVVGPIGRSVAALFSVLDLPAPAVCEALANDLAEAQSRGHADQLTGAINGMNNYFDTTTAGGGGTSSLSAAHAHSSSSSEAVVRRRQEAVIKAVHNGLPFRSLVAAIRKLSDALAAMAERFVANGGGRSSAGAARPVTSTTTPNRSGILKAAAVGEGREGATAAAATSSPSRRSPRRATVVAASSAGADALRTESSADASKTPSLSDLAAARSRMKAAQVARTNQNVTEHSSSLVVAPTSSEGADAQQRRGSGTMDFSQRPMGALAASYMPQITTTAATAPEKTALRKAADFY